MTRLATPSGTTNILLSKTFSLGVFVYEPTMAPGKINEIMLRKVYYFGETGTKYQTKHFASIYFTTTVNIKFMTRVT